MKKILAIGAHFDDVELAAAGTLNYLSKKDAKVFKITLTDNVTKSKDLNLNVKFDSSKKSSHKACKILGVKEIQNEMIKKCNYLKYDTDLMQYLEKIIIDNEIDTVSGNLTLDSSGGTVIVDDILQVTGAASAASLTLSTDLAVAHGGTGLSSFTGKGVVGTNAGGSALTFLTSSLGTTGDMLQYNASGVPIVTNIIDGGTY